MLNIKFTTLNKCVSACVSRIYVQLPTETAHCYHDEFGQSTLVDEEQDGVVGACEGHEAMEGNSEQLVEEAETQPSDRQSRMSEGLHPMVSGRLQELVAAGHTDAFTIRKMLRCVQVLLVVLFSINSD
jgi:hypothetical protein